MESVFPLQKKGQQHQHADNRGDAGGESGPENPHAQRENENIVQKDVGKTSAKHCRHGKLRRTVVSDETQQHIVAQEHGRKQQDYPQISLTHFEHSAVGAQSPRDESGAAQAQAKEDSGQGKSKNDGVCKILVGGSPVAAPFQNRVPDAAAHAD